MEASENVTHLTTNSYFYFCHPHPCPPLPVQHSSSSLQWTCVACLTSEVSVKKVIIKTNPDPFGDPLGPTDLVAYHRVFVDKLVEVGHFLCILLILILILILCIVLIILLFIRVNNHILCDVKWVITDCPLCLLIQLLLLSLHLLYTSTLILCSLTLGYSTLRICKSK